MIRDGSVRGKYANYIPQKTVGLSILGWIHFSAGKAVN
jgi:hypothetical protein